MFKIVFNSLSTITHATYYLVPSIKYYRAHSVIDQNKGTNEQKCAIVRMYMVWLPLYFYTTTGVQMPGSSFILTED